MPAMLTRDRRRQPQRLVEGHRRPGQQPVNVRGNATGLAQHIPINVRQCGPRADDMTYPMSTSRLDLVTIRVGCADEVQAGLVRSHHPDEVLRWRYRDVRAAHSFPSSAVCCPCSDGPQANTPNPMTSIAIMRISKDMRSSRFLTCVAPQPLTS